MKDCLCLARFAFESNRVKPRGRVRSFLPNKEGEVSVACTDGMGHCEIAKTGQCLAELANKETVHGWERLCRDTVTEVGLRLRDDEDVCGAPHASIVDWPSAEEDVRQLQEDLVERSTLVPLLTP